MQPPCRGEVWLTDFNPTRGHEQAGIRPGLVVSVDEFNHGPAGLAVVLPLTTRARGLALHVAVNPPEGGLKRPSFIKCDDIRSLSRERLLQPLGQISADTIAVIEARLRRLLGL